MVDIRSFKLDSCKTLPSFLENSSALYASAEALREFDRTKKRWIGYTYEKLSSLVQLWRRSFASLNLAQGSKVAVLMPNGVDFVCTDMAALSNGLVAVPLHSIDTPRACAYILNDSQADILVTNKISRWTQIQETGIEIPSLKFVVVTSSDDSLNSEPVPDQPVIICRSEWLERGSTVTDLPLNPKEDDLACIVYTSGTTGRPKGVMLTHKNIVSNVLATLHCVSPKNGDVFLSFLPLSHTFERTAGYYLALATGCTIVYNRSILLLAEDLKNVRPDVIISVPRVYERIHARIQDKLRKGSSWERFLFDWAVEIGWRDFCKKNRLPVENTGRSCLDGLIRPILVKKVSQQLKSVFGGRLRIAISGGAVINPLVAKTFCGLGLPIIQGYGMTENSPIIAGNDLSFNQPNTVGKVFNNVKLRLGDDQEIQIKAPSVMKGYWNRPEDTAKAFTEDGWLKTGDVGDITSLGMLRIIGRIKDIIVTSTGEKIPPADLESAIETDSLFSQCYVIGENRPFISLIAVVNPDEWRVFADLCGVSPSDPKSLQHPAIKSAALKRAKLAAKDFPHYALPRAIYLTDEAWTIENGLLTPTLKIKRTPLSKKFSSVIAKIYSSHC